MRVNNQDYEKMEELYELYEQKIYSVAYSILNNIQLAEDSVKRHLSRFITFWKNYIVWILMSLNATY